MGIQRKTKSLDSILNAFGDAGEALSVKLLLKKLENQVNKTTVYRLLEKLVEDDVLYSFVGVDGVSWYARCRSCSAGSNCRSHPHFQCVSCNQVRCLQGEFSFPVPSDVRVTDAQILMTGYCGNC